MTVATEPRLLGPGGQRLLFGGYAWFVTVAPVLSAAELASVAGVAAALAPLPLVAGLFVAPAAIGGSGIASKSPNSLLSSALPLVFLALSSVAWLAGPTRPFERLDRPTALSAVAAWFLFAFVTAGPSYPRPEPIVPPPSGFLEGLRRRGPLLALFAVVAIVLFALASSFGADLPERRILLALLATGAGVVLVAAAGGIFTDGDRRIRRPWLTLALAVLTAVATLFLLAARHRG